MLIPNQRSVCEEAISRLDQFPILEDTSYYAYLVPIRHNDRLNQNLIQLEEFCEYIDSNMINNINTAISSVCESNYIDTSHIGFSVEEPSCYTNDNIANMGILLRENGYDVYISPISSDSIEYKELLEALDLDLDCSDYEDSPNLVSYCEDVFLERSNIKSTRQISRKYSAAKKISKQLQKKSHKVAGADKAILSRQSHKLNRIKNELKSKLSKSKTEEKTSINSVSKEIENKAKNFL